MIRFMRPSARVFLPRTIAPAGSAQAPPAAAAAPKKIQVLIISGQQVAHNWKGTTPLLRKALEDTGKFEVRVTEEFRGGGPETLAPYDLVVLNYSGGNRPEMRWGARADAALLDFVSAGKGIVVYHFSMQSFDGWAEYEKISGANWRPNFGHHSAPHDFTITVTGFTLALGFIVAPLLYVAAGIGWINHSMNLDGVQFGMAGLAPEIGVPLIFVAGVFLLFAMMHVARGIGHVHGAIAKSLLVRSGS